MKRSLAFLALCAALAASAVAASAAPKASSPAGSREPAVVALPPSAALSGLQEQGFAVLEPGTFMSQDAEAAFEAEWRRRLRIKRGRDNQLYLYYKDYDDRWGKTSEKVRRFIYRQTAKLRAALPGEDFDLRMATIQVSDRKVPRAGDPHIDRNASYHLVLSYPLGPRSRGTVVYPPGRSRKPRAIEAGPRSAAVFAGIGRELATGRPAIVHAAPAGKVRRRAVLLLAYVTRGAPAVEKLPRRLVAAAVRRQRALARRLAAATR